MSSVKENLQKIRDSISECEIKFNRKENSVKLMAVSKFHPESAIEEAIKENQLLFGENRVQEANEKFPGIILQNPEVQLHMIGSLQTNKVKTAVKIASCIQSVDRIELLEEISKQCAKIGKKINVLLEFHTGEESKAGFQTEEEVFKALDEIKNKYSQNINPLGFMTMAPFTENESLIHQSFIKLRTLKEKAEKQFNCFNLNELSMGMSGDYKIAIEEGSTLVRVGTAIFGERIYNK